MKRAGDAKPVESLQTSLDLGLQALREKGNQPEITVHAETGLLIVRATPRQMGVIRSAINAVQARTQSMLRKVLAQEQVAAEFQSIESRIHEIEQWLVKSLRLAEEREKAGGLIDPSAPIRLREEAEKRTLRLRERASELQLAGAIARPALLDASPIGGPRLLELEAREAEALAKAAALAATDPVSAQLSGLVREQHSKIAEAERTLEGARRKLEDLVRKLQVVPVVKPAEGVK